MTYNAIDVAKHIITYCSKKKQPISNLKLQKIIYYTWVDYYKATGTAIFVDDICAWQFGPVVPSVYYEYCSFAGTAISREYDISLSAEDITIINPILDKYMAIPASVLVDRTHEQGSPWDIIYQNGVGIRSIIPFSLIRDVECAQ